MQSDSTVFYLGTSAIIPYRFNTNANTLVSGSGRLACTYSHEDLNPVPKPLELEYAHNFWRGQRPLDGRMILKTVTLGKAVQDELDSPTVREMQRFGRQ